MKKKITLLFLTLTLTLLMSVGVMAADCTVKFCFNGISMAKVKVKKNGTINLSQSKIAKNTKLKGYYFEGWYTKSSGGTKWSSSKKVKSDMKLYSHWRRVPKPSKPYAPSYKVNNIRCYDGETYWCDLTLGINGKNKNRGSYWQIQKIRKYGRKRSTYTFDFAISSKETQWDVGRYRHDDDIRFKIRMVNIDSAGNWVCGPWSDEVCIFDQTLISNVWYEPTF